MRTHLSSWLCKYSTNVVQMLLQTVNDQSTVSIITLTKVKTWGFNSIDKERMRLIRQWKNERRQRYTGPQNCDSWLISMVSVGFNVRGIGDVKRCTFIQTLLGQHIFDDDSSYLIFLDGLDGYVISMKQTFFVWKSSSLK